MNVVMRFLIGVSFVAISACGGGGDSDCENSDCKKLAALNNKTLSFTYDFGQTITDVVPFTEAYDNQGPTIFAFLEGTAPNGLLTLCIVVSDISAFDFWCLWLFSNGDQNSYLFSVDANDSIQGFFAFTPLGQNALADVLQNPDASFYNSSASRSGTGISNKVSTEEMQVQRLNAEMSATPIPVESTKSLDSVHREIKEYMSDVIESYY